MPSTISSSDEISSPKLIVITSSRVVLDVTQNATSATLEISPLSGKFVAILPQKTTTADYSPDTEFFDYGDLVVMPGLVDAHVHIDEPYASHLVERFAYL
jgi:allantoinase